MVKIYYILIYQYIFFPLSLQQIINNPIKSDKEFNPIDYIIIFQSDNIIIKTTNKTKIYIVEKDFDKFLLNSYIFSQSLLLCKDESNRYFFLIDNKCYNVTTKNENDIKLGELIKTFDPNIKYFGYIKAHESSSEHYYSSHKNERLCSTLKDEIIIYGNSNHKIFFYYMKKNKNYSVDLNSDDKISCKLVKYSIFICVFTENNIIKILHLHCRITNENELFIIDARRTSKFLIHENPILYDTSNIDYKILCANNKINKNIECLKIYTPIIYFPMYNDYFYIYYYNITNEYQTSFSYEEDNCNYTIFNSEYLICCGKIGIISCYRKEMNFETIINFNINLLGKISNLTFDNNTEYIKLIYSNKKENEINIYEYFIYLPSCINIEIRITSYQTVKVNISNLFERKTNTNYYISFDNLPINFATFKIKDEIINNNDKILIEEDNYLYIICKYETEEKNYTINYTISIEETYFQICQISIIYKNSTKNNIELILDFISSDSSTSIISNSGKTQVISTTDKMSIEEQIEADVSPVDLGDCTKSIKQFYNISDEENLIILNQEIRNNNEKNKSLENNNDKSISLGKYSQIEII